MSSKREGNSYRKTLALTKEMKMASDKLVVREHTPNNFPLALRSMRTGLLVLGALTEKDMEEIYKRKKVLDDEIDFDLEKGLIVNDFRKFILPSKEVNEKLKIDKELGTVLAIWNDPHYKNKKGWREYWIKLANAHPDLPNAKKLIELI